MSTILAFHGNPGSPEDWDILAKALPADYTLIKIDLYKKDWKEQISKIQEPVILVGHSWGCSQILRNLRLFHEIETIILVTPYLNIENPIPAVAETLLNIPIIGKKLIQSSHKKSWTDFLDKLIYPAKKEDLTYFNHLAMRLSDWKHWKTTALTKIEMQKSKEISLDSISHKIHFIWGEQDAVISNDTQIKTTQKLNNTNHKTIKNAGHGLIWTHPHEIVNLIKESKESHMKIGYFPGLNEKNNVVSYMEKHIHEFPERIALRWVSRAALAKWDGNPKTPLTHDEINFRNFSARINSFAQGLLDIGIQKNDRVIIFLPMSLDMYTAMFAVQRIGGIAVFLDSWARSHHLGASAECVSPKAMISFKQAFDLVDQVPEFKSMPIRIIYGPGENSTHRFEELLKTTPAPIQSVESETTALITFTTGSTGKPKGANRTHRFLSAQHHALSHVIPYEAKDSDMPAFPIFSLNNLATGVTTVLPALDLANPSEKDSALLVCQILNEKITCTTLSPSMLVGVAKFCAKENIQLSGLRRVVTGGAPISKDDVRAFYKIAPQTDLWILYGSTEAEPMAHIEGRDMLKEVANPDPEIVEEGVNVGHISEDINYKFIRIIDGPVVLKNGRWDEVALQDGEVGEFICTGDHVCRDYYNNPEAFKSTKIMDSQGNVWHRTGDLAYIDNKKDLWIVGRVNNAIERLGKYYFPVRAEVLLKRFSYVYRCGFLGIPDLKKGKATCAAIELKSDLNIKEFNFHAAREEIKKVFQKNNIPLDHIHFVKSIPMDPRHHSKVEYKVLLENLQNKGEILD